MKKYDEATIARELNKRNGVTISSNKINVSTNAIIGIRTWGKIDYLLHYCGYKLHKQNNVNDDNIAVEIEEKINKRIEKRKAKLNMANMAKKAMRNVKQNQI